MSTPVLMVVAGHVGAGKSRFARLAGTRTGARVLDLAEMLAEAEDPLPTKEDYVRLLAVAGKALALGQSVVVVGPFHTLESRREVMRVASDAGSALLYIECTANATVRRRRVRDELLSLEKLEGMEKRLQTKLAADDEHERVGYEVPRACQMHIDTTVGVALWAALAASRVEAYLALGGKSPGEEQVLRA